MAIAEFQRGKAPLKELYMWHMVSGYSSSEKPRAQEKNLRVKILDFEVSKT